MGWRGGGEKERREAQGEGERGGEKGRRLEAWLGLLLPGRAGVTSTLPPPFPFHRVPLFSPCLPFTRQIWFGRMLTRLPGGGEAIRKEQISPVPGILGLLHSLPSRLRHSQGVPCSGSDILSPPHFLTFQTPNPFFVKGCLLKFILHLPPTMERRCWMQGFKEERGFIIFM